DDVHKWYWLCAAPWLPIIFYAVIIFIGSLVCNKSIKVAVLSVPAAFIQLFGYGCGFLAAWWKRCVGRQKEFEAFKETFYE
ncbi:MAG: glycosyl transferase family 2, partial [Prevotella sp.]|nr:glycosyl transferase family 2 [Prevotella sp.]